MYLKKNLIFSNFLQNLFCTAVYTICKIFVIFYKIRIPFLALHIYFYMI